MTELCPKKLFAYASFFALCGNYQSSAKGSNYRSWKENSDIAGVVKSVYKHHNILILLIISPLLTMKYLQYVYKLFQRLKATIRLTAVERKVNNCIPCVEHMTNAK